MADAKTSALTALTGANVDPAADVIEIVDTSVTTSKKILVNELGNVVQTLTGKRITPRVLGTTSSATPTINTDNCDVYRLTAQAEAITSFTTNLTGTPVGDEVLIIKITGTAARAISWGTSFEASTVSLPTTTVTTAMLTVAFMYNDVTNKWRCMGKA